MAGATSRIEMTMGVMLEATPNLQTARIFAAILILTLVALLLFGLVSLLERICVPWAPRGGSM